MKKLLGWFVAALFLLGMVTLTIPHLLLNVIWSGLRCENESAYRKRLSNWVLNWVLRYLSMVKKIMRLQIDLNIQKHIREADLHIGKAPRPNPIIIANHRTVIDHPIVALVAMKYYGINDIRWVLKSQMRRAPVVGWLMEQMECAFVSRSRDSSDIDHIHRMIDIARIDEASVMIYPEGTRFNGIPKPGSPYMHVRDPKHKGFGEICANMGTRDVLVILIDWDIPPLTGKTMWDGNAFVGRRVKVHAFPIRHPGYTNAKQCLHGVWQQADNLFATNRRAKIDSLKDASK